MRWPPSPTVILAYIAVIATAGAIVSGWAAWDANNDNETLTQENTHRIADIEQVQRETCEGRNVLRQIQRTQIQREIDQSIANEQNGLLEQFFPNVNPGQLHALLEEQRNEQRADKLKLAPEDCTFAHDPSHGKG